jgi:hypothetical protein
MRGWGKVRAQSGGEPGGMIGGVEGPSRICAGIAGSVTMLCAASDNDWLGGLENDAIQLQDQFGPVNLLNV